MAKDKLGVPHLVIAILQFVIPLAILPVKRYYNPPRT